jgi:hypothetical protein
MSAGFHVTSAREVDAFRLRPIAIVAVADGTRCTSAALDDDAKDQPSRLAGVLRDGFDD